MKKFLAKLCHVAFPALFAIAACKKTEKADTGNLPVTSSGRIIQKVYIQNDSAVYIPLNPGDSVRQPASWHKVANSAQNVGALAVCEPSFTIVSQTGPAATIQAVVCFSVTPDYTDWYLNDGITRVAYLGTTGTGVITFPPFLGFLTCGKSYTLEAVYQYTDASNIPRIGINYSSLYWTAGAHQIPGLGVVGDGADVKITELNGNGIPDLVFMAYDDAPGANSFKYFIKYDVSPTGNSSSTSSIKTAAGMGNEGHGAGLAIEDIDGNGSKDLILMAYDDGSGANSFRYRIGYNLNSSGDVTHWSSNYIIPGVGDIGDGAGVAFWDLDQNGVKDIVLMAYDDPSGANSFRYKVGWNMNSAGAVSWWGSTVNIAGVGVHGQGAGLDIKDLDGNGYPEFFFMAYDDAPGENSFAYRIVHNVNTSGTGTPNANVYSYRGVGADAHGAGIALGDIDGDSNLDMILMAYDDTPGNVANTFRYRVGYNLPASEYGLTPYTFWCGF